MLQSARQRAGSSLQNICTYICPSCRISTSSTLQHPSSSATQLYTRSISSPSSILTTGRKTHRTYLRSNSTTTDHSTGKTSEDYDVSLHSQAKVQTGIPQPSRNSQIRTSLRAWSVQNEEVLKANAPETIETGGRISRLPNALFVGKDKTYAEYSNEPHVISTATEHEPCIISQVTQPGTLLWYENLGMSSFAVFVGNIGVQSLLAVETGSWVIDTLLTRCSTASINLRPQIPDFLNSEEIELLKQYMPKSKVARPIAGSEGSIEISMRGPMPSQLIDSFTKKMRNFRHKFSDNLRDFAGRFEEGYSRVADDHEYRMMSLRDYLRQAHDIDWVHTSSEKKMAITHHLSAQDSVTTFDTAEELSVLVMSKAMNARFHKVIDWARHYQDTASQAALGKDVSLLLQDNPLTAFIDRARRLILTSRKSRSPTKDGSLGPSPPTASSRGDMPEIRPPVTTFTETDQMIIDFIWTFCYRSPDPPSNGSLKMQSVTTLILRAVGAYPDLDLSYSIARLFLKEIGCMDPWAARKINLALPLKGGKASHETDALYDELASFLLQFNKIPERQKLLGMDSMHSIRKKWTNLTAFAIDTGRSQLLEDAVSIEPAAEIDGGHWVHVHVAHITAFFDSDSIVGRFARNQGTSIISCDRSLSSRLIPKVLAAQFSLREGSPVLTISTLVAPDGTSVEVKMSAGILGNVVSITRDAVNEVLQIKQNTNGAVSQLLLGVVKRHDEIFNTSIAPEQLETANKYRPDLASLLSVTQRRSEKRALDLPEKVSMPSYTWDTKVDATDLDTSDFRREQKSYHWNWDPSIALTARHQIQRTTEVPKSSDMVAQLMKLAAESAARWLTDRQIPVVFIGTEPTDDNSFAAIADKDDHEPFLKPIFRRSSSPLPYWNIHVKSFCSCTSPFRRYIDMLVLWQIDSYLKAEAAGSIPAGAAVSDDRMLSFTKASIDEYLRVDAHNTDTADRACKAISRAYSIQAIFRAFHFEEAVLPKKWEVYITRPARLLTNLVELSAHGHLVPFGQMCVIISSAKGWERMAQYGQFLPVEIKSVDVERACVYCQATGPPSDTQKLTEPIYISSETSRQPQTLENAEGPPMPS